MNELEILIERFKQHGYKMTPQRRTILQTLCMPGTHLAAEQIYEQVRQTMPDVSIATIYNTLRELVSIGVVHELELGFGKHFYEVARMPHAHLVCLHCNVVRDIAIDQNDLRTLIAAGDGFVPISYEIVVQGYCADCYRMLQAN